MQHTDRRALNPKHTIGTITMTTEFYTDEELLEALDMLRPAGCAIGLPHDLRVDFDTAWRDATS